MRTLALALPLLLLACSEPPPPAPRVAVSVDATHYTYRFPSGMLVVLEVPVHAGRRVEVQRCFVWVSDRGEALQCPGEPDAPAPRLPDDPVAADRH